MPMTEIVRYLNHRHEASIHGGAPNGAPQTPFISANGQVYARYANLHLESRFQTLLHTADGRPHGHAATLHAFNVFNQQSITDDAVFVVPSDDEEFIYLDRLVRTLHVLNYLTHRSRGDLLLRVHQRHVLSVQANHGLAFEEILRPCGLMPKQVTLEIDIEGVEEVDHFMHAIDSYHARGYRIAIHRFGRFSENFALLQALKPQLVRLDARYLESAETLERLTRELRALGILSLIQGIDTPTLRQSAAKSGVDLLQIYSDTTRRLIHA